MTADLLCTTLDKIKAGTAMTTPQAIDGVAMPLKYQLKKRVLTLP